MPCFKLPHPFLTILALGALTGCSSSGSVVGNRPPPSGSPENMFMQGIAEQDYSICLAQLSDSFLQTSNAQTVSARYDAFLARIRRGNNSGWELGDYEFKPGPTPGTMEQALALFRVQSLPAQETWARVIVCEMKPKQNPTLEKTGRVTFLVVTEGSGSQKIAEFVFDSFEVQPIGGGGLTSP